MTFGTFVINKCWMCQKYYLQGTVELISRQIIKDVEPVGEVAAEHVPSAVSFTDRKEGTSLRVCLRSGLVNSEQ